MREMEKARAEDEPIYKMAEEAEEHIFTVSLEDYAVSQGRSPSEYLLSQITGTAHGGAGQDFKKKLALIDMYKEMQKRNLEAVVGLRYEASRDFFEVFVTATGTGLRLRQLDK
jgi:hypothetical protein